MRSIEKLLHCDLASERGVREKAKDITFEAAWMSLTNTDTITLGITITTNIVVVERVHHRMLNIPCSHNINLRKCCFVVC